MTTWPRGSRSTPRAWGRGHARAERRGFRHQVVAFGEARRTAGRGAEVVGGGRAVAAHLVEVSAGGVQAVVTGQLVVEWFEEFQTGVGAVHHGGRDRAV